MDDQDLGIFFQQIEPDVSALGHAREAASTEAPLETHMGIPEGASLVIVQMNQ